MGIRTLKSREGAARTRRSVRRNRDAPGRDEGIEGTVRLDRRTKRLVGRLKPGNIAVVDHDDIDRVSAESLLEHGVAAVVNARPSISGRYPNLGPLILAAAGVPLIDAAGDGVFTALTEGEVVRVVGGRVLRNGSVVAEGTLLDERSIRERMDAAHANLSDVVERFAENTMEYVRREQDILLSGVRLPELRTTFEGRHAVVVTRGYHYKEDLHALRGYIGEVRPVVVAVDGAADACLAEGIKPDLIFGDMDSASASALGCGAELLVHGYTDGTAPGLETVRALGHEPVVVTAPGTSEDVAMLLAHENGAELIVAVGSHTSTIEFLDKGRQGMASTFLVRLRIGPRLVDAKGVSLLYRARVRTSDLVALVLAALVTMGIVTAVTPSGRLFWSSLVTIVDQLLFKIGNLL